MDTNDLLGLRKAIKNKKPDFVRQDANKKKGLRRGWRKPKGLHSKLGAKLKGRPKSVSQGYRSPKKVRGMHKSGLRPNLIKSLKGLDALDPKKDCIIVSSSLGDKKKIFILKKAIDRGIKILNIKDPEEYIKKREDKIQLKKKKEGNKKKETKPEDKTLKKQVKKEEKTSEESKKETEKKEKDKILTKRGA